MKKFLYIFLFLTFSYQIGYATHQRAAEIIYKHLNGLTYEVKIITYTRNNAANESRNYLPLIWGDGNYSELPRVVKTLIQSGEIDVVYNEYIGTHTYPGVGTYILSMEDPNRNYGVVNIPNSVNVPIYVETELIINPFVGGNNSVQLLNEPIDHGCVDKKFVHNPGAYDIDGDSLSFRLIKCRGAFGDIIPGYVFPDKVLPDPANSFTINPYTGDVVWDVPNLQGEFNFAFIIEEWRNGVKVGSVVRDMQVIIGTCDFDPPVFNPLMDTCVEAGQILSFDVSAYSPDGDMVSITASGGPFEQSPSPAYIDPDPGVGQPEAMTTFFWQTNCSHVRHVPYQVFFKAVVSSYPINLVDYKTINIKVIAPEPENLIADPLGNKIQLSWDVSPCENAVGYKIYRRNGYYGFIPGYCETGVPAYTGYKLIHVSDDVFTNAYDDDDNGQGLVHGINYCYMVTARFEDGGESYASLEACAALKRDLPVITNVSNDRSTNLDGRVYTAWSKPVDLDTIENPGPYQYRIYRAEDFELSAFTHIATNYGLNDTIYTDNNVNLNTSGIPYRYRIDLFSETVGEIGPSAEASSVFTDLYETDEEIVVSWDFKVPWFNDKYTVYRKNPGSVTFDSVGSTDKKYYHDEGLINGHEYCYYVKSTGSFSTPGIIDPLINYSQKTCGIPVDNVPPCPPVLNVETDCETSSNLLIWSNPNDTCDRDIAGYLIYYSPPPETDLTLLDSIQDYRDTTYLHANLTTVIGCYAVKAFDSIGNISDFSNVFCVDTLCGGFRLPNVFTPNGDDYNQYFKAFPGSLGGIQSIKLVILNRWGTKVYETTDKYFEWDGTNKFNNRDCPEAVYFFICDVFEYANEGVRKRTITGSVTLLR